MIDAEDFSRQYERKAFGSVKWLRYGGRDVIPLWVADMDFPAPPAVRAALVEHAAHGIPGYAAAPPDMGDIVVRYCHRLYDWSIDPDWLIFLPGLVVGLNLACRAACDSGEKDAASVATFSPVYPPFLRAPGNQGMALIDVPLACADTPAGLHYTIDTDALAAAIRPDTRLLLLCHPHNPVGRAWQADELRRLADIVERHDLLVCSDDIHCDLLLEPGARHQPFAALFPDLAARCITLMAPSKTYNIAGLGAAFAIIPDAALRRRFRRAMAGLVPDLNAFAWPAMRAALSDCEDWRQALLAYLRQNRDLAAAILQKTGLPATVPEATFLTWIDARGIAAKHGEGDTPYDLHAHFERHGLGLSDGKDFGAPGFVRLNFGCPRPLLAEALERLQGAAV
jgi:cysteine-S-conjugate beta-lyase